MLYCVAGQKLFWTSVPFFKDDLLFREKLYNYSRSETDYQVTLLLILQLPEPHAESERNACNLPLFDVASEEEGRRWRSETAEPECVFEEFLLCLQAEPSCSSAI